MSKEELFKDIKVGDYILYDGKCIEKVTKVTPTRFIAGGTTFYKANGRSYGTTSWYHRNA